MYNELATVLSNIRYIEAKCTIGQAFELVNDYIEAEGNRTIPQAPAQVIAAFKVNFWRENEMLTLLGIRS